MWIFEICVLILNFRFWWFGWAIGLLEIENYIFINKNAIYTVSQTDRASAIAVSFRDEFLIEEMCNWYQQSVECGEDAKKAWVMLELCFAGWIRLHLRLVWCNLIGTLFSSKLLMRIPGSERHLTISLAILTKYRSFLTRSALAGMTSILIYKK